MQDENGVVYAHIDNKKEKTIGLIAHMDTAPTIQGGLKNPKLINKYDGSIIKLNEKYSMSKEDFPSLETVIGEDILVTDGEHLMGGDDKAGIAIIIESIYRIINDKNHLHGDIKITNPDELLPFAFQEGDLKR